MEQGEVRLSFCTLRGTEPLKITGNGTFTSEIFLLPAIEQAGAYLFFGFNSSGTTTLTIDNLEVIADGAAPEPSSLALMGMGFVMLMKSRRRRSQL